MWENHLAGAKTSSVTSYLCCHEVRRYECQCVPYIWPGMPGKVNYPIMNVCFLFLSQAHKNGGKNIMDENTTVLSHPWPSRDLQTVQVPGSEKPSQSCPPSPFPPPENKQRKSTLFRNKLCFSRTVCLLLVEFFESDNHEKDTEVTCCYPTGIFDPQQWVSFFSSDSPLRCWYSLFPTVPPTSCQHLLPCTPVQYGNLESECRVFDFAEVGRCESPVSKAQTVEQRGWLVVTSERMY